MYYYSYTYAIFIRIHIMVYGGGAAACFVRLLRLSFCVESFIMVFGYKNKRKRLFSSFEFCKFQIFLMIIYRKRVYRHLLLASLTSTFLHASMYTINVNAGK